MDWSIILSSCIVAATTIVSIFIKELIQSRKNKQHACVVRYTKQNENVQKALDYVLNRKRVPIEAIHKIVDKISIQKGIKIDVEYVKEANHMFSNNDQELMEVIRKYLNSALDSSEYLEI